jgi:hypothetical protein
MIDVITLPRLAGPPGPIHSLVHDDSGNLYYSDELNHVVASLDPEGRLRWQAGAGDGAAIRFRYPRGLALGSVSIRGHSGACLAVADAWNNRVVLLGLGGRVLGEWTRAGESALAEVSDVRYVGAPAAASGERGGYWLVLDRGHHRLCALDATGALLFEIGRPFSPYLTVAWRVPHRAWVEENGRGVVDAFEPLDALFYPTRIVGDTPGAIYLWEPLSRRLKQVLAGSLLPTRPDPACDEWLAADADGVIGWCAAASRLQRHGAGAGAETSVTLDGVPVSVDPVRGEVWIQKEDRLERRPAPSLGDPEGAARPASFAVLVRSAEEDLESFDAGRAAAAIERYLELRALLLGLADELAPGEDRLRDGAALQGLRDRLDALARDLRTAETEVEGAVHLLHLAALKWRLSAEAGASAGGAAASGALADRLRERWRGVADPFAATFVDLMRRHDVLMAGASAGPAPDAGADILGPTLGLLEGELWQAAERACCWSGYVNRPGTVVDLLPPPGSERSRDPAHVGRGVRYPRPRPRPDGALREVARWVLPEVDPRFVSPSLLAPGPDGSVLVGLWKSRIVLQLDDQGRLVRALEPPATAELQMPCGIALDARSRLWITDGALDRVIVCDLEGGRCEMPGRGELERSGLHRPLGICPGPEGSMLVADSANHRIVRISLDGESTVWAGGAGPEPGRFRIPRSVTNAAGDEPAGFWVTDHRNHRIQRLDALGRPAGQLGGCGLERGRLVLPLSAAAFADGVVAVSMGHLDHSLRLLSSDGIELGDFPIDYSPGDLLCRGDRLLVPDFEGNAIRLYCRA